MSARTIAFLSQAFGQQENSDCSLVFCCNSTAVAEGLKEASAQEQQQDSAAEKGPAADKELKDISGAPTTQSSERGGSKAAKPPAKRRRTVQTQRNSQPEALPSDSMALGDPLPAHTLILSGGSERFRAQLGRWVEEQGYGAVLHVPLDSPGDLQHALSAVKFLYTGKLDASDAATLLRVRRQAAHLQVEDCTEACDEALLALITAAQPSQQQQAGGPLAGVSQLYCCRDLLSRADMAPATLRKLLDVCRQQLVKHAGSAPDSGQQQQQQQQGAGAAPAVVPSSTGGPVLVGELLAWAFGDAPSLMNDQEVRKQMEALPAAAMEALLDCDSFATDSESTVLLMLLTWLEAHPSCTAESEQRLLKLIRLTQLSRTYLVRLLPLLACRVDDKRSIISAQELRIVHDYASAPEDERAGIRRGADSEGYDVSSAWYRAVPRPEPTAGEGSGSGGSRSYEWSVDATKLWAEFQSTDTVNMYGEFTSSGPCVVANGLEWYPGVKFTKGKDAADIYVYCQMPSVLRLNQTWASLLASPGFYRVVVYKWVGGQRKADHMFAGKLCGVGLGGERCGWGTHNALPVKCTHQQRLQQLLASFGPYLKDGKLWGCLSFGKAGELETQ
ncbi:hypothetical protein PLESTM_000175800 [Pleodorina starrii]|nr:hypothetical protein PLESTM_000175800 [Pleodorina starrii]